MHETAQRLFEAIKEHTDGAVDGFNEPGKLAMYLGESPATVNNWKTRGVSKQGMLKASNVAGINPAWISNGTLPKFMGAEPHSFAEREPITALTLVNTLADWFNMIRSAHEQREVSDLLRTLTYAPDSQKARQAVVDAIERSKKDT